MGKGAAALQAIARQPHLGTAQLVEFLDETVVAEVDSLPNDVRSSLARIIARIQAVGLEHAGEPHVRHLEGKLWEMRPHRRDVIGRALYVTAIGRRIVIVLAFAKKTGKTPRRIIDLALARARLVR